MCNDATLDDIDPEAVEFFVKAAIRKQRLSASALNDSIEKVLRNLGVMNDKGLTRAALLLFGKNLKQWSRTATFRIGRFGVNRADLIMQDEIVCPLIMMPDKIISILRSGYLVSPIHYEGLQRIEPLEIPEEALREMICNAIVHKDYTGTFTQMRIMDDKIELWNHGTLPPNYTIETLLNDHESLPRNSLIADTFYMAGYIESWGRGYEKIRNAFEKEHLQIPVFEQVRGGVMATIRRERFMAIQQGRNVSSMSLDVGSSSEVQLTDRQREVIRLIGINPSISAKLLAQKLNISMATVKRELTNLSERNIIEHKGALKGGHWYILIPN